MNTVQTPDSYAQPPHYLSPEDESLDYKRYISLFVSNWYWFAIALFLALSIAYGINRWSEKIYTVSSTMLIKDDKISGTSSGLANIFPGADAYGNQQNIFNEIGILKSFSLNLRVLLDMPDFHVAYVEVGKRNIVEKRLYNSSPFIVTYDSLEKQILNRHVNIKIISEENFILELDGDNNFKKELRFGERFNERGYDFFINRRNINSLEFIPGESNKYYFYFVSPLSLANRYKSGLSVIPLGEEATLVTLSITGQVPEQESDYLNKLMKIYIKQGMELKNETAERTIMFIDDQLGLISDSLALAEGDMESFRLNNRFIDLSREGVNIQNKLEQIENEKIRLMLQKNYYEYLNEYIQSKNETGDIVAPSAMGITDQLLIKMVDNLSQLQKQKLQLAMNLQESLEPFRMIEASILVAKETMIENIKSELQNIDQTIKDVETRQLLAEKSMDKLPSTERKMINIQRKFDINNTVYTFLLEKKAEAGIARASNVPDNRIIDYAGPYSTSMIAPKSKQNLLLGFILGLIIPMIAILLIDLLNDKIIDKKDIEKRTSAPVLGLISHNNLNTEMPVVESPGSTLAESFRSIRTDLKYFLKGSQCPVISVSSTISSEGKTFISSNLAAILALSGKKVLLIGLDLRKPRIHKILKINNDTGMSNFLIGEEKFENVVIETGIDNLWYTPAGPIPPNPAELIESDAMGDFIQKAKKRFDFIIIDTPPVAIVTDALLVSAFTDFYLFVVRQRYSSKNTIELIEECYKNKSIKSLGIVVNDVSLSGYYGYGLRYGYAMGYGYNYGYNYYNQYGKYGYSDSAKDYYKEES